MNDNKVSTLAVVIINCICALIWNINLFIDISNGDTGSVLFVVHVICAILWDICAVIWTVRYIKQKRNKG